ncbi:hypothetical protein B0A49_11528 [Cryomyces minteri]|uniref:Anaphase-promoting complex subunit 4 n=1 Tax=Cryomyces minteri TaxID=331657 RepID=A0A4U0WBW2_9PEZI|nr:hypothetical protein B0A49_11528 [Cryomyces minteri]
MKEWLVDQLRETGWKRWDHDVNNGYHNIVADIQLNLLPALERCTIVASTLRGLAVHHGLNERFNIPAENFTQILDRVHILRIVAHSILVYAGDEGRQFSAFSKWLRFQIDMQVTEPGSIAAEETAEQEAGIDYIQVLAYVEGALNHSKLDPFLTQDLAGEPSSLGSVKDIGDTLDKHRMGVPVDNALLATTNSALELDRSCREVYGKIAAWQASNTSLGDGAITLEKEQVSAKDMRMVFEKIYGEEHMTTYVIVIPMTTKNLIHIHRIVESISSNSSKEAPAADVCTLKLPTGEIRDIKFVDDDFLMAILYASHLITIQYSGATPTTDTEQLSRRVLGPPSLHGSIFQSLPPPNPNRNHSDPRKTWDCSTITALRPYIHHTFPAAERFVPEKLAVNGRKHRRAVCVLGRDRRHYKVFDLDNTEDGMEFSEIATEETTGREGRDTFMSG